MERTISIGRINAIKRVKAEIESVRESMNELGAPILTDWALLPDLYKLFRESFSNRHVYSGVDHRRKFIFVALYLYCPASLVGERMPMGFRKALADTLGLNATTTISDNSAGLMVMYRSYPDFRRDVDLFYEKVMLHLENTRNE